MTRLRRGRPRASRAPLRPPRARRGPSGAARLALAILWMLAVMAAGLAGPAGRLAAQNTPPPESPPPIVIPPGLPAPSPPPGGFPVEIGGDRPRNVPEGLRQGNVLADSGVEIGVGTQYVTVESRALGLRQGPPSLLNDGGTVTVDLLLKDWRLEYAKLLLERNLNPGTVYHGLPVDTLSVDANQFWVFYGWRPAYPLYFAGGLGYENRVVRLSFTPVSTGITATQAAVTDNPLVAAALVEWAVSLPVTLQLRVFQEQPSNLLTLSGIVFQLGYIVSF